MRDLLKENASKDFTLDLGCGNSVLVKSFPNRIGMDVQSHPDLDVVGDAHSLPFLDDSFQQIVCSEVLEHLKKPQTAVKEMHRVLGADGKLIITMPFVYPLHEGPHDYQRYTEYGLRVLFEPLFNIEEIRPVFSEEQTLAILLQRIAFQRHDSRFRYYFYLLLAHILFRMSRNFDEIDKERIQGLGADAKGAFLTANYMLIATKLVQQ